MHFQTEDGQISDTAYMDGYSVGDTLLEGCIFECKISNDRIIPTITPACAEYFSRLNTTKWLSEVHDAINDTTFDSFLH